MIAFSISDYIAFSISALIYGFVFPLFECLFFCFCRLSRLAASGLLSSIFYKGSPFCYAVIEDEKNGRKKHQGELLAAVRVIVFSLGFIVLSFAFMDGQIRLFALCLAIISYILFSKYVSGCIKSVVFYLGVRIVKVFVIIIRISTYIPRRIILGLLSLFGIFCKYFKQNNIRCKLIAIDKQGKK